MILLLHILVALAGIVSASYGLVKPSRANITASWVLVAATVVSGVALVIVQPSAMTHLCVTGLTYVTLTSTGIVFSARKLALSPVIVKKRR